MINIKLDDKYKITSDDNNYILMEIKTYDTGKNAGQSYERPVGYYSKPEQVLEGYLDKTIKCCNVETLEDLLVEIRVTRQYIKSLFNAKKLWED